MVSDSNTEVTFFGKHYRIGIVECCFLNFLLFEFIVHLKSTFFEGGFFNFNLQKTAWIIIFVNCSHV